MIMITDAQRGKKGPYAICECPAKVQMSVHIRAVRSESLYSSTYTASSTDYVSRQRRPKSVCAVRRLIRACDIRKLYKDHFRALIAAMKGDNERLSGMKCRTLVLS